MYEAPSSQEHSKHGFRLEGSKVYLPLAAPKATKVQGSPSIGVGFRNSGVWEVKSLKARNSLDI